MFVNALTLFADQGKCGLKVVSKLGAISAHLKTPRAVSRQRGFILAVFGAAKLPLHHLNGFKLRSMRLHLCERQLTLNVPKWHLSRQTVIANVQVSDPLIDLLNNHFKQ